MAEAAQQRRVIALFDVDQTLTPPRQVIRQNMIDTIAKFRAKGIDFGIVSGSDLVKVREQCTPAIQEVCAAAARFHHDSIPAQPFLGPHLRPLWRRCC